MSEDISVGEFGQPIAINKTGFFAAKTCENDPSGPGGDLWLPFLFWLLLLLLFA